MYPVHSLQQLCPHSCFSIIQEWEAPFSAAPSAGEPFAWESYQYRRRNWWGGTIGQQQVLATTLRADQYLQDWCGAKGNSGRLLLSYRRCIAENISDSVWYSSGATGRVRVWVSRAGKYGFIWFLELVFCLYRDDVIYEVAILRHVAPKANWKWSS